MALMLAITLLLVAVTLLAAAREAERARIPVRTRSDEELQRRRG